MSEQIQNEKIFTYSELTQEAEVVIKEIMQHARDASNEYYRSFEVGRAHAAFFCWYRLTYGKNQKDYERLAVMARYTGPQDCPSFPEIRSVAKRLSWDLSRFLNSMIEDKHFIQGGEKIKSYTKALEWLGAVICDDWTDLKEVAEEVQTMPRLWLNDRGVRWGAFVRFIMRQAELNNVAFDRLIPDGNLYSTSIKIKSRDEIEEEYRVLGIELGLNTCIPKDKPKGLLSRLFRTT